MQAGLLSELHMRFTQLPGTPIRKVFSASTGGVNPCPAFAFIPQSLKNYPKKIY
jgi:hypothetical protein